MRNAAQCAILIGVLSAPFARCAKAPFTFDAMMSIARIDDPQLSPDGKWVAFTVQTVDMPNNTKPTQIYVVPIDRGEPEKLTNDGLSNGRPRWAPDSQRIYFLSDRSEGSQVWSMKVDGSDQKQLTSLPTEADGVTVSPDGKVILFTSEVYPACTAANSTPGVEYDAACNKTNLDQDAAAKMKARVYTSLLYRHWTHYESKRRQHLMTQLLESGHIRDLTPGSLSIPPFSLGGPEPYAFSPDSTQITYEANTDSDLATSTNSDLFTVAVAGGEAKRITTNPGADEGPLYSPDGKSLAYRTQIRGGYESDQWRLAVMDLQSGKLNTLADSLDRWVEEYTWSPDSKRIFFTLDDHGTTPLMMIAADGSGSIRTIAQGPTTIGAVQFTQDNHTMVFREQSGSKPAEIRKAMSKGGPGASLTHFNDGIVNQFQLTPLEKVSVDAADGTKVEGYIVKPPDFNPTVKYPVLYMLHGGPEGEWGESWSYRWNAQVLAGAGYVVVMPNPRGSIGYGQGFTDGVNADWGGRAYDDVMSVVDYVSNLPYVDRERMAAAGGSYGGYLVDWILGHTDRFRTLVSHAGVYDLRSAAGTTDELWFAKWEFQGMPWENPELYEKWSPSSYSKNFKTPTLVIHGELDYRVPIGQGQQLFTALQELKIPSKLVQFPDEGHWILKPQNSQFWYATMIDWLNEYTRKITADATPTAVQ